MRALNTMETFFVTIFVLFKIIMINITYTFYHLYMRKKIEFESRLLNILYSHIAFIMQLGSITNLILILHILQFLDLSEQIISSSIICLFLQIFQAKESFTLKCSDIQRFFVFSATWLFWHLQLMFIISNLIFTFSLAAGSNGTL